MGRRSDTRPHCRWCDLHIYGLARPGKLGGMWAHVRTRREACGVAGHVAEPRMVVA